MSTQTKSFATRTVGVDLEARTVRAYITTPTIDEEGEVLLSRGADLSRFTKTGTVFDVHQYGTKDVVGRCLNVEQRDDGIIATTRFTPRPPAHPEAEEWWPDTVLWLFSVGDVRGWSVGFASVEGRSPTKKDLGDFGENVRYVHTRWRLLEYSVAPLPCNEDALALSMKGMVSTRVADLLRAGKRPTRELCPQTQRKTITLTVPAPPRAIKPSDLSPVVGPIVAKSMGRLYWP